MCRNLYSFVVYLYVNSSFSNYFTYSHPDTTGRPQTLTIAIQIPLVDLRLYL